MLDDDDGGGDDESPTNEDTSVMEWSTRVSTCAPEVSVCVTAECQRVRVRVRVRSVLSRAGKLNVSGLARGLALTGRETSDTHRRRRRTDLWWVD